jgi:hypothetical protein
LARIISTMFDALLVAQKIVCDRDFASVHYWMNEYCNICHWQNREVIIDINEFREMILSRTEERDRAILTDYLRVAIGHILLASLTDGFSFRNDYEVLKIAFKLFIDRNFNQCNINLNDMLMNTPI